MDITRRKFLNTTIIGSLAASISSCKKSNDPVYDTSENIFHYAFRKRITIHNNNIILFQGDSITECNRNKSVLIANDASGLGNGYASKIADKILQQSAFGNVQIYNRGVSGNKVGDLLGRWKADCLNIKPSVISILVGINDLRYQVSPNSYYRDYKNLLQETKLNLPSCEIIIGEPFIFPNFPPFNSDQNVFHEYRKIVRLLAKEFDTVFIPYYDDLEAAYKMYENKLSDDGFHPTLFAHELMADFWMQYL
ncbi:MAG: SGNH/GDSL hydrolase family protein [Ilyomonas sp.]